MKSVLSSKSYAILAILLALSLGSLAGLSQPEQERRTGLVEDWSMRHVVFARSGPVTTMMAAQRDPRSFFSWRKTALTSSRVGGAPAPQEENAVEGRFLALPGILNRRPRSSGAHVDWSISLGGQSTAPAMFPAKFSFDINAAPSCANDFVIFPVNQAPDGTHENLVAFRNLYSGTVPANGMCNRTASASDSGVSATVLWSYAVGAISGHVSTSPVLSLDGIKVAFVESVSGQQPHFHVLAWKSGDGVDATNLQNAQLPSVLNSFVSSGPAAGSGTATDLAFGASGGGSGDAISSPFVDYASDTAYVGDDRGNLVRIKNVFCFGCAGTPPAPSMDGTWGTGGTVVVGAGSCAGTANSRLTGPVQDPVTGNVYVGCADGKLYGFTSSGNALATPSVTIGNGTALGGVVDPPIVDGINGFVYAVSGTNGSSPVLVQAKANLSSPRTATLGGVGGFNLHSPTFNDAYFSNATSTSWLVYVQGYNGGGNHAFLYGAGFDASRNMVTGTPANSITLHVTALETSPLTEFLNGSTDRLFLSLLSQNTLDAFNINAFPAGTSTTAAETGGTSGIIVDNVSAQNQASSIYFATLGGTHAAVKLTQAALQ
ncbi:MAG TPA: hypothetical protein VEU31_00630 [Candidatus Acidoferrales bacterium]|nr:hypothetical protein [Candidatus Acidoferrales bacterium]